MSDATAGVRLPVAAPVLSRRRRLTVLAICCISLFLTGIDTTVVNLALPAIRHGLHTSTAGLQWTIDAYTVVLASLLMSAGVFADRLGRKRTLQAGLTVFTVGSVLCSAAPNFTVLIVARAVQAVGASMLNPIAMSIIRNVFTDATERAHAIGIWGSVFGVSLAFGPVLGGVLVTTLGWRSIFWLNIPVAVLAGLLAQRFVPESRAAHPRPLDPLAQVLLFLTLASITFALIEGPRLRWSSPLVLLLLCGGGVAGGVLVLLERGAHHPLIDLRYFRSAPFSGASLMAAASFACLGSFLFLNSLYLQDTLGMSALRAGVVTLPIAVGTMVLAPISGRLITRAGNRASLMLGGFGLLAGSALMLHAQRGTPLVELVVAYLLFGGGFGSLNPPVNQTAVSGMPSAQAGVAAAITSTSRQVGQTLGVALLGIAGISTAGTALATVGVGAWPVPVTFAILIVVVAVLTTGRWALGTAQRVRQWLPDID